MNMASISGPSVSSASSGSISRMAGTDRSEPGQPALNVGIASRLVNQEQHTLNFPIRFHDAFSGPRFLITPHQFGHIPVGYTVIPQSCAPFFPTGISAQGLPIFPGMSAGMRPVIPSHISTFDAASLFAPYLTQHIPLHPDAVGPTNGDGIFQYPLHHLTGTTGTGSVSIAQNGTAAFRVPEKSAVLPSTSGSSSRVSSSSLIITESSHQQEGPEDTVDEAESTGRVLPVHIFDNDSEPPLVAPEDLSSDNCDRSAGSNSFTKSRGQRRFAGPVRPGAKRHKHTKPRGSSSVGGNASEHTIKSLLLAAQTSRETEMQRAAKEWSADAQPDDLDPDCWDFLQRFKEKQRRLDTTFVETRSVFSTLTAEQRENVKFAVPKELPDVALQQCNIIKKQNKVKASNSEKIIESADVDPDEMRQFAQHLTQSAADIGPRSADEEAAVLRAVGLVEKADAGNSSKQAVAATMNKSKNSRSESRKRSRPDSSPRQNIRRELEDALVQLTTQMVDLKRKVNAVKKLVKDEVNVSDSEISNISKELQRILSNG